MVRALAIKELRETRIEWILGAAWMFVVAMDAMRIPILPESFRVPILPSSQRGEIPFVGAQIASSVGVGMAFIGAALGLRQTVGELRRGTYPLTLHLPLSWRAIFAVKIAVGLALVCGLGAAALGVISIWAATPGHHPSPFEWSMTCSAWRVWFAAPIVYLGGIATGLLPARWFGTRLFPLIAAGALTFALTMLSELGLIEPILFFALAIAAMVVFAIVIDHLIAIRDFA